MENYFIYYLICVGDKDAQLHVRIIQIDYVSD